VMSEAVFLSVFITAIYFVMGIGVWKLSEKFIQDAPAPLIVILWPVVLLVESFKGSE